MIGERYYVTIKRESVTGLWLVVIRYNRFWFWPVTTYTGWHLTSVAAIDDAANGLNSLLAKEHGESGTDK